jgi:hypothetical protein
MQLAKALVIFLFCHEGAKSLSFIFCSSKGAETQSSFIVVLFANLGYLMVAKYVQKLAPIVVEILL